ncbi:Pal1 cell morphology protein-domain-containing protein [Roridomyces roridus]|uniref:Pal1 cell morphology protein-domain-containing protein n=1 Tax=Roridomyces roridus TaxID=1738132 RepID=A0AAD7BU95_9AGAR|nr:Pal1 cell morphology protein-domain-containing protein [Roridomyces roridus]
MATTTTAISRARQSEGDNPFADDKGSPPVPPKKHRQPPSPAKDIVEQVRDTVVVRGAASNKMARSQTTAHNSSPRTAPPMSPRSVSQDSVPVDKVKKSKKGGNSKHADVIDRLDYTGVGPMFHHDGPFDACAPSRNKQKNRAPMMAWGAQPESPKQYNDNPYPSPNAYSAFSPTATDYEPPKKKVDAIAEAWGIHEPEPYEEFFAGGGGGTTGNTPASSIYNGKESTRKQPSSGERPRAHARRSQLPPPMPIFVPDGVIDNPGLPDSPGSPDGPKRNKSIMHRIRKMRDAPNVPVTEDEAGNDAVNGDRPGHRSQNSFLGRLAGNGRAANTTNNMSPTSETSESYVFIEPKTNPKDLPPTPSSPPAISPREANYRDYFDEAEGSPASPGGGLGRKTSLMKKVGRVVRGTR